MVPLAPVRFSTTIDWPIWAATCSSTILGTMSTALPAVSGTTARMVLAGHCCAMAGTDMSAARIAAKNHKRLIPTSLSRQGGADRSPDGAKAKTGASPPAKRNPLPDWATQKVGHPGHREGGVN